MIDGGKKYTVVIHIHGNETHQGRQQQRFKSNLHFFPCAMWMRLYMGPHNLDHTVGWVVYRTTQWMCLCIGPHNLDHTVGWVVYRTTQWMCLCIGPHNLDHTVEGVVYRTTQSQSYCGWGCVSDHTISIILWMGFCMESHNLGHAVDGVVHRIALDNILDGVEYWTTQCRSYCGWGYM